MAIFHSLPAEGDLKSGIPAFVEIPAPHMMIMFLNLPSENPDTRSASEKPPEDDDLENPVPIFRNDKESQYFFISFNAIGFDCNVNVTQSYVCVASLWADTAVPPAVIPTAERRKMTTNDTYIFRV